MKTKIHSVLRTPHFALGLAVLAILNLQLWAFAQGTAFTYQGQLMDTGAPANGLYDIRGGLYASSSGGALVSALYTNTAVPVSNGLFTIIMDFGDVYNGTPYWLQIGVRTNGAGAAFKELSPRQELTPTPYAIFAEGASAGGLSGTLPTGDLSGSYGSPLSFTNPANSFAGNGSGLTNVNAGLLGGLSAGSFWKTAGNAGTSPTSGNYVGTSDNNPLELHVYGTRGLRLEPDSRGDNAPNLIGGYGNNAVQQPGSGGDVIGGGGVGIVPNLIYSNSSGVFIGAGSANQVGPNVNDSVVGGGFGNTIQSWDSVVGGGVSNTVAAQYSFVGGGLENVVSGAGSVIGGGGTDGTHLQGNLASGQASVIGGGLNNTNSGYATTIGGGLLNSANSSTSGFLYGGSTVAGGEGNKASTDFATVGGGVLNTASGLYSTVPGGLDNVAGGAGSFAAGQDAQTTHANTFIWGDASQTPFTGANYDNGFNVLASGGVFFFNGPEGVHVDFLNQNTNSIQYGLRFGAGSSGEGIGSERVPGVNQYGLDFYTSSSDRMSIANNGFVGINTTSPSERLEVNGQYVLIDGANADDGNGPIDAYIGGSGSGSDVQIGSMNSAITAVGFWNYAAGAWMHIACSSITINGGSDVAEPFTITSGKEEVPQGAVVVIDKQHPGQLRMSDQPYDRRVAGVVSGANGIKPGIQMQQQGLLEGGKNVALTGRVYVLADASNGPIEPGDLLTTSSAPGHAMKVTDHARAQGAILGKAMTGLSAGDGMVLVLVTLQ